MKKLNVLCVMLAVLVAGLSVAEEDAAASITGDENNPLNAVVKLEVSTTKPDFCRPWGNRTDSVTGSGVVIGKERILTCAHCVTDACYIRVRKHNVDRLYHGSVLFVNDSPGRLLEEAGRFLSEGVNVVVFPEGSRTPIGGELRPFQRGAAQMAARAHAPVLPVTIDFDPPVLAKGQAWHDLGARTIVVRLRVHDAIEPDSLSGATPHAVAVALTDEAHRRIVGGRRAENLSDASM